MWSRLRALPPYAGGKRRLLGQIFKHLPAPCEAPVFVDAFLGGGSVSLFAKAKGYRVLCNDIALRSHVVGKALIENDRVTLSPVDVVRLFRDNGGASPFIEEHFAPDVVTTRHARFLDRAFVNARDAAGTKRWLLLLLVVKYILRMRPMGNFGAKTIIHQAEQGRWEEMNPNYLRDVLGRGVAGHPKTVCEKLRRQINRGVFSNGHTNESHKRDVFEFLAEVEGDILYLDPPYAGTSAYETSLQALDAMIEGTLVDPKPSPFSRGDAVKMLEMLFDAARRFPLWVVSYGNAAIELEVLTKLVEKFRPTIVAESFRYTHLTGLSGKDHRERNREFLIVARREGR